MSIAQRQLHPDGVERRLDSEYDWDVAQAARGEPLSSPGVATRSRQPFWVRNPGCPDSTAANEPSAEVTRGVVPKAGASAAIGFAATLVPARRATRVNPLDAFRHR